MATAAETPRPRLWPLITRPRLKVERADAERLRCLVERFVFLTSPSLAAHLLEGLEADGPPLIDPQEIERSVLLNRFRRHSALKWAELIEESGIDVVYLKGLATSLTIYPDPDIRGMQDVDLLVHERDVPRLVKLLSQQGFSFRRPEGTPLWGRINETSFHPFVSADGTVNLDIHIHPDDFPVHRSLTTEIVFDAARLVEAGGVNLRLPCDDHLLLLAITNAARDKFGPASVKSLVDAVVLLAYRKATVDWAGLASLARHGGYLKSLRAFVVLLHRLGVRAEHLPDRLNRPFRGMVALEFDRMVAEIEDMIVHGLSRAALLRREFLLTARIDVFLFRNLRRLRGLLAPRSGTPEV